MHGAEEEKSYYTCTRQNVSESATNSVIMLDCGRDRERDKRFKLVLSVCSNAMDLQKTR